MAVSSCPPIVAATVAAISRCDTHDDARGARVDVRSQAISDVPSRPDEQGARDPLLDHRTRGARWPTRATAPVDQESEGIGDREGVLDDQDAGAASDRGLM